MNEVKQQPVHQQFPPRKQTFGIFVLRILAFVMDASLITIFTMFVLVRILLPEHYNDALNAFDEAVEQYSVAVDEAAKENKPTPKPPELAKDERVVEMFAYGQGLLIISLWLYFLFSEVLLKGTTLGKKIFGLVTVSTIGNLGPPSIPQTILRSGIKAIALYGYPIFFIDYLIAFVTRGNRAGHDLLCRTWVTSKLIKKEPLPEE